MAKKAEDVIRKEIADCTDINGQVEVKTAAGITKVWPVDAKAILDNDDKAELTGAVVAPIVPGVKPEKETGKPKAAKSKATSKDK